MPELEPKKPKPTILIQLDTDPQPSVFDAVVAIDSGVDQLLRHGNVQAHLVRDLVHGAMFTRGGEDLRRTALFVGGSDFRSAESILNAVVQTFFDPSRISVFLDAKGANTTAAAAVLVAGHSMGDPESWDNIPVAILGYGPVGHRVAYLLARLGATVQVFSPDLGTNPPKQAEGKGRVELSSILPGGRWQVSPVQSKVLIAAGPAGVEVLPSVDRDQFPDLKVAVDLNAVPPHGLGGTKPTDADKDRDGVRVWGALGVGGLKMKIHKAVIRALFDGEPTVFDIDQVYEVGREVLAQHS